MSGTFNRNYKRYSLNNPFFKSVTSYFDKDNIIEDNNFLTDDVASFYKIQILLSKRILQLNDKNKDNIEINSNRLLIITSSITTELIYKLSDLTPLLFNLSEICQENDSSELKFKDMYGNDMKGGMLEKITKALGLAYTEIQPLVIENLKGSAVEITHAGQNILGRGVVTDVIRDSGGSIVSANLIIG